MKSKDLFRLFLITIAAFLISGYHPGVEDSEIYVPGVKKLLNPSLYPFNAEFFSTHARMTLFPNFMAACVRLTHLSLDTVMLIWHITSIFLVLLACWQIATLCFDNIAARWTGVCLVAALLTLPVAGTALYIMDQDLNPRSLALLASLFSIVAAIEKKYFRASLWIILGALFHRLMAVFGLSFIIVVVWLRVFGLPWLRFRSDAKLIAYSTILLPLGFSLRYPSPAYREIIQMRPYFFLLRWHWYEWLGLVAPIFLFWWFAAIAKRRQMRNLALLCDAVLVYQLVYLALGLVMTVPPRFLALVRYQPMRSLQLVYVFLILVGGGFLGEWVLRARVWRWLALFIPLCAGMFYSQCRLFPATPHIEWPGVTPKNDWLQAFAWIRQNTPENAFFVLNPNHMARPGEDQHGFRVLAERSMLADAVKDSGALTMFPELPLAEEWQQQMKAQQGWDHFRLADFERLHRDWGVTWAVIDQPGVTGLSCPYANSSLRVCQLP